MNPRSRHHGHDGPDGAGNLICLACDQPRQAGKYLCLSCWTTLPARAQASLKRRDRLAVARLRELVDQIRNGTPLAQIEVAP